MTSSERLRVKEYVIVYTTNNRRYVNKIKFYFVKYSDSNNGEVFTGLLKLGAYKDRINKMVSLEITNNFLISMHEGNQIAITSFFDDGLIWIGAVTFKIDIYE